MDTEAFNNMVIAFKISVESANNAGKRKWLIEAGSKMKNDLHFRSYGPSST